MTLHYRVAPKTFEMQMKYLKDHGYHPITLNSLFENIKNQKTLPEKPVVLTFDDGWKNQYTNALPILEKYGYTASFAIVTNLRGGGYMSWDDVKSLHAKGFEISSHSENHFNLTKISDEKLKIEIEGSKKILEEKLGAPVTTFVYPYYAHNQKVMDAVESARYLGARAGWGKFQNDSTHIYEFVSQEAVNNPNPFSSVRIGD